MAGTVNNIPFKMYNAMKRNEFLYDCANMSNLEWVNDCRDIKHEYAWLPKTCAETQNIIWLKKYYKISRHLRFDFVDHTTIPRCFDEHAYIKLKLQA